MLDQLPLEVILNIYDYLKYEDVQAIRLTCKKLYEYTLFNKITTNEVLCIDNRASGKEGEVIMGSIQESVRKYHHVKITSANYHNYSQILPEIGEWVKSLWFKDCSLNFVQFVELMKYLPRVEIISITGCCNIFLDNFVLCSSYIFEQSNNMVKELEITNTNYLTDEALHEIFILFPNLQYVSIEGTSLNCHEGTFNFNYAPGLNVLLHPSINILSIQYMKSLIESRNECIRGINFSHTKLNNIWLKKVLSIQGLHLERLILNNCQELRKCRDMPLGSWQGGLIELQLSKCRMVTNEFLQHIGTSMLHLKILNLSSNEHFNDLGLLNLADLKNITELNISKCPHLSSAAVGQALTKNMAKTLKVLNLSRLPMYDTDLISILYSSQLQELDLSFCRELTNYSLCAIYISQKHLKKLDLTTAAIDNEGITGFNSAFLYVKKLDLQRYQGPRLFMEHVQQDLMTKSAQYQEKALEIGRALYCLNDLHSLTSLSLKGCYKVTDASYFLKKNLPNLKELCVASCFKFTSYGLIFVSHNFPNLETLDVSETNIDDVGVAVAVQNLKRLKNLYAMQCLLLTNIALEMIYQHCKRLQILHVTLCTSMAEFTLDKIKTMPSIIGVVWSPSAERSFNASRGLLPPPLPFLPTSRRTRPQPQ